MLRYNPLGIQTQAVVKIKIRFFGKFFVNVLAAFFLWNWELLIKLRAVSRPDPAHNNLECKIRVMSGGRRQGGAEDHGEAR